MAEALLMPKRVLVCGGIDFRDRNKLTITLDKIFMERGWMHTPDQYGNTLPNVMIISGAARGADQLAIDYALANWCSLNVFLADWEMYGRSAGPIRNKQMFKEGCPDLVIAFPGGRGTANMVKIAKEAGVEVVEIS